MYSPDRPVDTPPIAQDVVPGLFPAAVECKTGDKGSSAAALYFAERTTIPLFYQVHRRERSFQKGKVVVLPFADFCAKLELP